MAKIPLSLLDTEVDTDDPGESAQNLGLAALGVTLTAGVVGSGMYLYNKARDAAGVNEEEITIPGV
ncbi:sugar kinase [Halogeometricum borinquense]|uniref:sugar kinase n=1 Tax=Halogeometricum borinquense TaxID=60847 RepID=UPI00341E53D7